MKIKVLILAVVLGIMISFLPGLAVAAGEGNVTLTASLGNVTKSISLTVDLTAPTILSAERNSDTQITVMLNEPCFNLTNVNDGGFTITETGTSTTFAVSGTTQGADSSQVILSVADMNMAEAKGVTITYTAGGNGTITDLAGNSLATDNTGVVIDSWIPKLDTPGNLSWDVTTPAQATWGTVANASSYTVQLYQDSTASGSPVTGITNTNYDFTSVITETGSYTFTVTAIRDDTTYLDSDTSSNSPTYTVTFSAPVAGFSNALSFSGNTGKSKIIVPYNDSTKLAGNTDFTISMWICPNNNEPYQTLYRQHGTASESLGLDLRFIKNNDDEGYLYYQFNKLGTGWQRVFNWGDATSIANVKKAPMNQWTHVALVKSGKSVQTYINGEADVNYGQMTLDDIRYNAPAPASADISIGVGITAEAQYFSGRMDEVQYWNTALDKNQIEAWMYREIDSTHNNYNNLIYYYKLNENSGIAVGDSKGTNNGTAINITDSNWVSSDIHGWTVNAGTTLNGKLVGSDIDGTSTNGTDWNLTFAIETQGDKGEAAITEDNQFTYTVGINQEGSDSFQYKVCDSSGIYSNVQTVNIDIIAAKTISGNAGVAGAALSYNDGTAKTAMADETGAYSLKVPYSWSGAVTPSKDGYTFSPASRVYTNVQADQTEQDYTAAPIINAASVSGIIAPAAGGTPIGVGSLEGTGAYTVTNLTWQNSDGSIVILTDEGKFKAGSTYQAVIELTAAVGYKFQVLTPTVDVGTAEAGTINAEGSKLTFIVTFAATEARSVAAIAVKTQPSKLTYTAGETLDLAGLAATLTYNDTSTLDVALADFEANSITANPEHGTGMAVAVHNGQSITLTCNAHTATTDSLTVSSATTYEITLSETGIYAFTSRTAGYVPVTPVAVTVTRIGTGNITDLEAALSGSGSGDFTLGVLDAVMLNSTTTSAAFTIKPNDDLGPGNYNAVVTVTADHDVSQGFDISFSVNAPPAPTIQSAAAGDTHVNISWSSVPGATGYEIYQSTTSGSYGAALATVAGSVNSYDATGLANGTTYFFVVRASIGIYDSVNSNEVSSTPQVPAPGAPILLTALAGDGQVSLTWSVVEGSIEYKVYASVNSGAYTSPVDTLSGSVCSCDVTGLINGTTYYFAVTASNAGVDSGYSNEISATPQASVPGAPTNVTATAGNGQATVSFTPPADNGGSAITGYTVISSPGNITATGAAITITVTGLSNGTAYTFTVTAANVAGNGPASAASNAVTPYSPSSSGSDGGSDERSMPSVPVSPVQPANDGADILVNGKTEIAATATTTREDDKTVTTVVVDDKKVEERLEQEAYNTVLTILVNSGADVVDGTLNGQTVKNMENKEAVLEIKTGQVTYTLPASQINIDNVRLRIGSQAELEDINVNVRIAEPSADTVKFVEDTANKNNYQVVVKPVDFEISCTSGDKTIAVSRFNAYVERTIAIPDGVDPSQITTGIVLNPDGTFSHVPTVITLIDGRYYAKINSLTNSTYAVISSPKAFSDVEKHWAREAVNDMASRLVVSGVDDGRFEPDRDITRAEFAVIIVRALGLMQPGTGPDSFDDVVQGQFYYDAVSIANEYDISSGYGNRIFGPDQRITREQAMTMIARTLKITGLEAEFASGEKDKLLAEFDDAAKSADYARDSIAACIKTGIISGRNENLIAPKDNITRAEVAEIVRRLLQKSKLI